MEDSNNNIYSDFPALMSDSRNFTLYNVNVNEDLKSKLGIKYNWEYRNYLTHNSNEIIKENQTEACKQILECYDKSSCIFSNNPVVNDNEMSDLKQHYVEKERLQGALVSQELPQYKKLKLRHPRSN